ncbi:hypothetical protein Q4F19_18985 [Sphingomonas sp. BIUV-7]|uniref:Uncharacterized protein n=1 Tax=Sphingomonas natans TaxID=3063330 RepID=A0ABT8YDM4_9SPHN|nr:hypothetical protein [Sphingomonas sp. BIUV-7]MDO6416476.1 hypothetical protein [Sphingomonas sp. BIUV-7]
MLRQAEDERGTGWLCALAAACAIAAIPILAVPMPLVLDYPNHLARLWLLAGGASEASFPAIYAIDWSASGTNILIDLIAITIGRVVPIGLLGPALLIAALLLPAIGAAMLGRAAFRRWSWWHLFALLPAWGAPLLLGFLNFQIGCGLALIGAAIDARLTGAPGRIAFRIGWAILLLVTHPFGLGFHAALLGGLALGPDLPDRFRARSLLIPVGRAIRAVLPAIAVVILFWLVARHPGGASAAPTWLPWPFRIEALFSPMQGYGGSIGTVLVALLWGTILIARASDALRVHAGLAIAAALLAGGTLVVPQIAFDTGQLMLRLAEMAWLTWIAAVLPGVGWGRRATSGGAALALAAVALRTADIGRVWIARQSDAASVAAMLAQVPQGARILPLDQQPQLVPYTGLPIGRALGPLPTYLHLPLLAVPGRHAFLPTLFAYAGKQVVSVRPPYDRIAVREGTLATVDRLGALTPTSPDATFYPYLMNWPCFDFVLVLNADLPNRAGLLRTFGGRIAPVADGGFARLYRIADGARRTCAVPGLR